MPTSPHGPRECIAPVQNNSFTAAGVATPDVYHPPRSWNQSRVPDDIPLPNHVLLASHLPSHSVSSSSPPSSRESLSNYWKPRAACIWQFFWYFRLSLDLRKRSSWCRIPRGFVPDVSSRFTSSEDSFSRGMTQSQFVFLLRRTN